VRTWAIPEEGREHTSRLEPARGEEDEALDVVAGDVGRGPVEGVLGFGQHRGVGVVCRRRHGLGQGLVLVLVLGVNCEKTFEALAEPRLRSLRPAVHCSQALPTGLDWTAPHSTAPHRTRFVAAHCSLRVLGFTVCGRNGRLSSCCLCSRLWQMHACTAGTMQSCRGRRISVDASRVQGIGHGTEAAFSCQRPWVGRQDRPSVKCHSRWAAVIQPNSGPR
jgi:hypothetical protein